MIGVAGAPIRRGQSVRYIIDPFAKELPVIFPTSPIFNQTSPFDRRGLIRPQARTPFDAVATLSPAHAMWHKVWKAGYTWDYPGERGPAVFMSWGKAKAAYDADHPPAKEGEANKPAKALDLGLKGEVYANAQGGRQTKLPHRLDLVPQTALLSVGRVLAKGAEKYGEDNWHRTTVRENINHAIGHALAYLHGDRTEPNLSHFATRALMALFLEIRDRGTLEV